MPSAGDQSAIERRLCLFLVRVERLWIELSGEGQNLLACDRIAAQLQRVPNREVLEIAMRHYSALPLPIIASSTSHRLLPAPSPVGARIEAIATGRHRAPRRRAVL